MAPIGVGFSHLGNAYMLYQKLVFLLCLSSVIGCTREGRKTLFLFLVGKAEEEEEEEIRNE